MKMKEKLSIEQLRKYQKIEEDFFDVDHVKKMTHIKLQYNSPKDIFDFNMISKKPTLTDDFLDWFKYCVSLAPNNYKVELSVYFDTLDGYLTDEIRDYFVSNLILNSKVYQIEKRKKGKIALSLSLVGLVILILSLFVNNVFNDSLLKTILTYVLDIGATVTFWEALNILVVERKVHNGETKALFDAIESVNFYEKNRTD